MKNAKRGLDRIWVVLACAYFIFALVYGPKKTIEQHAHTAREAHRALQEKDRIIAEAADHAQRALESARNELQSAKHLLGQEETNLETSSEKLSELQKELVAFDQILAVTDQVEKNVTAVYKQLVDDRIKEESSKLDANSTGRDTHDVDGEKVIEQLNAAADAKVEELRKQLPAKPESGMTDRREIQLLIKLQEDLAPNERVAVEKAKARVQTAEEKVLIAEKVIETKSWFPDLRAYDAQIYDYDLVSKWNFEDIVRIAFVAVVPIVLSWIVYRVILLVVLWILKGFNA